MKLRTTCRVSLSVSTCLSSLSTCLSPPPPPPTHRNLNPEPCGQWDGCRTSANCGPPWSSESAAPPCSSRARVTQSSSGPHRSQSRSRAELRFGYRTWMNLLPTARRSRRMVSFTGSSSVEYSSSLLEEPTGTEMSPSTGMSSEMDTSDSPANGRLASSAAAILTAQGGLAHGG